MTRSAVEKGTDEEILFAIFAGIYTLLFIKCQLVCDYAYMCMYTLTHTHTHMNIYILVVDASGWKFWLYRTEHSTKTSNHLIPAFFSAMKKNVGGTDKTLEEQALLPFPY